MMRTWRRGSRRCSPKNRGRGTRSTSCSPARGGTAVSAAELVLAHPDTTVTMFGLATPAGLLENGQFKTMAKNYATPETLRQLEIEADRPLIRPALTIVKLENRLGFPEESTGADGRASFKVSADSTVTGDAYIAALGRTESAPPVVADLVLAARRLNRLVTFTANTDLDGQYTHYSVTLGEGEKARTVSVTGAASRVPPIGEFSLVDQQIIIDAAQRDAHDKSGNFNAGFTSTANQAKRGAADVKHRTSGEIR